MSDWLERKPHWAEQLTHQLTAALLRLEKKINLILDLEGVIITDQDHLNTDVASLTASFGAIIDALKQQPGAAALDFTAADALVQTVAAAVPVAPVAPAAPVAEPAPVEPAAPVADTSVATA